MMYRSLSATVLLLTLILAPLAAHATTTTQGTFNTAVFAGSVAVTVQNGNLTDSGFSFSAPSFLATDCGVYSLVNTTDAGKTKHSVVQGYVLFSDGSYTQEPATAICKINVPVTGTPTVSLLIVDYYNPSLVLFSSGANPLPLTNGGVFVTM
jgi:hypothetical protein